MSDPSPGTGARRAPAGAAVMREELTASIRAAVLEELASRGYGRMSIEAVAKRAGVGKTTIYRRWDSKLDVVVDAMSGIAMQNLAAPDTGSLRGDLVVLLEVAAAALQHPLAAQILPDLLAEAARSPQIAETLQTVLHSTLLSLTTRIVDQAVTRGELPASADPAFVQDVVLGPLYWRLAVERSAVPDGYLQTLARHTAAALSATLD